SFLRNLECLCDSFGIGAHKIDAVQLSLQDAVCNVSSVNAYIKNTVAEVRQHYKMKETATINGPEGTVSSKTRESLVLLERGMEQLRDNVKNVNEDYLGDIDLRTLLTTQMENLHTVSHFKNETFTALQYAQDFGTILKESLKRTTKWGAKYFTLEKSYYPVPKSSVELRDVDLVKPPTADNVDPNIEAAMKELVDRYRPVKDSKKRINKRQSGSPAASYDPGTDKEERVDQDTNIPRATNEVPRITFVDESMLEVVAVGDVTDLPEQQDEFDTDSESDADNDTDITFSRFGRTTRAHFRLDF
ncbi:hypothetical protein pdam_00023710, partial [Pocillopora damicornis]